jgi:hypothetical protein
VASEGEVSSKGANGVIVISKKNSPMSLDKLRIRSDGRVLLEASFKTTPYSKLTLSAEDGKQEPGKPVQSFAKLGCEFNFPKFSAIADIDLVNGPIFKSSATCKYEKLAMIGAEMIINSHFEESLRPELMDLNLGFTYNKNTWNFSAKSYDFFKSIKFSYLHMISPFLTVTSQVDYRLKTKIQKMVLGSEFK